MGHYYHNKSVSFSIFFILFIKNKVFFFSQFSLLFHLTKMNRISNTR